MHTFPKMTTVGYSRGVWCWEGGGSIELNLNRNLLVIHQSRLDRSPTPIRSLGLYYKCFTIIIYNCNDSGQYYKTTITIVIDDPS